jgi:hypothetical protein
MTIDKGMLKFQPLVEAVIVIVISHRPEAKGFCSLFLNSYLTNIMPKLKKTVNEMFFSVLLPQIIHV